MPRFVKVWRVEAWEEDVRQTEVTEIDTLRDHTDYINAAVIRDNCLYSSSGELSLVDCCWILTADWSGDINVLVHEYPNPSCTIEAVHREAAPPPPARAPSPPPAVLPPSPAPQSRPDSAEVEEENIEHDDDTVPDHEEADTRPEEEQTTPDTSVHSEASSDTSTSRARRRRWLIYKDEVELKEEIGKGRYGVVYRGIYKKKDVAVKVSNKISEEEYSNTEEGIIKEVGSFCRCKHPSLVRYYGLVANKEELTFWLVTELLTGHSLASLIHNPEVKSLYKIRRRERLQMSACLAQAMDYIHRRGLVNGDLTPLNVMVCKNGKSKEVKITDYGLLFYKEIVEDENYTPDNKLMQNINCFVPPEVLVGHNHWTQKSDVWCLAALLLEFNLENYMWDNQSIERSKSNYINNANNKEPVRFGLKIRWSSFTFLWDSLSYQVFRQSEMYFCHLRK